MLRFLFIVSILLFQFQQLRSQSFSNWGYWLTDIDPDIVQQCEYELMVIDYSRTGKDKFSTADVNKMKSMPNGHQRMFISYFSIGEAEEYRYYWDDNWKVEKPIWLDAENPDWPGNYKVKYWEPSWQKILFGNPESYLDQIIAAGFDGIYLDIIDAFEYFEESRPTAELEMIQLIKSLAMYARTKNPDFQVITQNGERLLAHPKVLEVINGAAKEDLYYGLEGDNIKASQAETEYSLRYLRNAKSNGKYLLLASYVQSVNDREQVYAQGLLDGLTPYFGPRDLHRLNQASGTEGDLFYQKKEIIQDSEQLRTPGDFFLNTLYKHQFKSSLGALVYKEKSIYAEQNAQGTTVFSEDVAYTDQLFSYALEYGLTDHLEIGIRAPLTRTTLNLAETIGGDMISQTSEVGVGNIALTANLSAPIDEESNMFSLLTMEYGIPTDTKSKNLKSSSYALMSYTVEKIWNKWGIAVGGGLANFNLSSPEDNTKLTYRTGILGILSDRVFGDIFYSRRANGNFIEASAEILVGRQSSLELFFATDFEPEVKVFNYGLTFTLFH